MAVELREVGGLEVALPQGLGGALGRERWGGKEGGMEGGS